MQEECKTRADRLQESDTLRRRVCGLKQAAEEWSGTFDATSDLVFAKPKYVPHLLKAISQMLKDVPKKLYELEINDKIVEVAAGGRQ